ncbi:unnamed protein product [Enterobius vermicularis]|uniref:Uncharacterized protein n=1 Tax=Enterobius vermicularis TaxID=51028 RepID=A0A0N4VFA8_ENTVE|nr:unnamed protein product [Enterobius vermicularis]
MYSSRPQPLFQRKTCRRFPSEVPCCVPLRVAIGIPLSTRRRHQFKSSAANYVTSNGFGELLRRELKGTRTAKRIFSRHEQLEDHKIYPG